MKRRLLEVTLLAAGVVLLAKAGWEIHRYRDFQNHSLPHTSAARLSILAGASERVTDEHAAIGQISVPRLGMSAVMVEGDDEESLAVAAGHMKGTALIGSKGNAVVAGHRDTVFWPLRNIQKGDYILVSTDKQYVYSVERTQIVDARDTRALQDADSALLTLVTCYPFRHVGPAPKRFVVTAKLLRSQG